MKAGFYQFDVKLGQKRHNLEKVHERLIKSDFDLMILPEFFNTGYLFSSKEQFMEVAESIPEGETIEMLSKIARTKNGYVIGGIAEKDGKELYSTVIVVGPDGYMGKQRKIHLTNLEKPFFENGTDIKIFDLDGVNVGIAACFDAWFPELSRILMLKGAQIICTPANFGGPWTLDVIKVRAMENIVYWILSNRIGFESREDIEADFRGDSRVIKYNGDILVQASAQEKICIIDIDPEEAKNKSTIMSDDFITEVQLYSVKKK